VPALAPLTDDEVRPLLEKGEFRTYADGESVFAEGQPARALYFLLDGEVRIHRRGSMAPGLDLATLSRGAIFGEVALLARTERTASATALGRVTALRVVGEGLYADYRDGKRHSLVILLAVSRLLAERLEAMNGRLVEALAGRERDGGRGTEIDSFRRKMLQDWTV
jgi:CRP-like cAMP-binding protein